MIGGHRAREPVAVARRSIHPARGTGGATLVVGPDAVDALGQGIRRSLGSWTPRSPPTPAACWPPAAPDAGGTAGGRRVRGPFGSSSRLGPPPRMLVFGAIDFAAAVARVGAFLGYRVTVCDARPVFATPARFPAADEVVVEWPHLYLAGEAGPAVDARTVVCVLTHDAEVRRAPARGRPAAAGWPTSGRWALAAPTSTGSSGCARRGDGRRAGAAGLADRAGPRRAHPRGDRVVDASEIVALQWGGRGRRLQETSGAIHHHGAPDVS